MKYFLLTALVVCVCTAPAFSQCDSSTSSSQLNVNDINATIDNAGMLWTNMKGGTKHEVAGYEAPKGGGVTAIFTGGLWIGGIDGGGQLHLAASTYRQNGYDYSVGPYNYSGSFNFDTVWAVFKSTIDSFKSGLFGSIIPNSIKYWPGQGNPSLPTLPNQSLAPFVDVNNNGIYDPSNGDYPLIRGDESAWEIYNDAGCTIHTESGGLPLDIEVHLLAYSFNDTGCLNNTTFYQYDIINESSTSYDSTLIGLFIDPDLGCYEDDYIGCVPALNMGVCYNGEAVDGPCTPNYGKYPPLLGVQMVNLPADENGDTMRMSYFMYYDNDYSLFTGNPSNTREYYDYIKSVWRDSTHLTTYSTGHGGTIKTNYAFPSDPTDTSNLAWSECHDTIGGGEDIFGDRRFIMGFGPFTFRPGATESYTYDVLFDDDTSQIHYPCPSFASLINMANCVKEANVTGINQITANNAQLTFYPNPMSDAGTFLFKANTVKEIKLFNILGEQVRDYDNVTGTTVQMQKDNLSAGLYIYMAALIDGNFENGKIVVQ